MRRIAFSFFENSPYMAGPAFTLLLFFGMFMGVLWMLYRGRASRFDPLAQLPLLDDSNETPVRHD